MTTSKPAEAFDVSQLLNLNPTEPYAAPLDGAVVWLKPYVLCTDKELFYSTMQSYGIAREVAGVWLPDQAQYHIHYGQYHNRIIAFSRRDSGMVAAARLAGVASRLVLEDPVTNSMPSQLLSNIIDHVTLELLAEYKRQVYPEGAPAQSQPLNGLA